MQAARLASAVPLTTPIRLYASEHAHPHILAVARCLGLSEAGGIRLLPVDGRGRLLPRVVQAAVQEDRQAGWHPLFVIATIGTPTLGSCDPVASLADICTREQLWLHVDATLSSLSHLVSYRACCWPILAWRGAGNSPRRAESRTRKQGRSGERQG